MQNIKTFFKMFRQLLSILTDKQKWMAVLIGFLSMISAMLETLGLGVVMPFILTMLEPQVIRQNIYIQKLCNAYNISDDKELLLFLAIGIISVYVLKNSFILFTNYVQTKFRNELERDLSVLMMKSYLYRPYLFHINTNSAKLMRGITGDTSGVASIVDSYSTLANEGLTCLLIGATLVYLNPLLAIGLVVIVGATALLIITGMRKKIALCGRKCREAFAERYKNANQAMGGIKEIDVMQRQENFLSYFKESAQKACEYNTKYLCISKTPSRMIEVVFISSLIVLVYLCLSSSMSTGVMIAQFGTLALAAVRILPSVSSITNAMNSLVYNRLALESACENIKSAELIIAEHEQREQQDEDEKNLVSFQREICIDKISWKYQENLDYILRDVSLCIQKGESIAFVGESGAGKTTLADILLGIYRLNEGRILVDGIDVRTIPMQWAKMIGYVPQNVYLLDDTVRQNVLFGIPDTDIDEGKIWRALEQAKLKEFVESLPKGLDTIMGERGVRISGGQRQRIAIARALYYNPDILVLDEATSALDNDTEKAVMEAIEALQGEKTLIIVAHRLTTIQKCSRVFRVEGGTVGEENRV